MSAGKLMKDGAALSTYDVQDGHTVHLVAKPPTESRAEAREEANSAETATASSGIQTSAAWERGRDRLRQLLNSVDGSDHDSDRERDEPVAAARGEQQSTAGRRLTGDALNIAVLREALSNNGNDNGNGNGNGSGNGDGATGRPTQRLPRFRSFFQDLGLEEESPESIAAEMGLAPPSHANSSGNSTQTSAGAAALDLEHIAQGIMTVRTVLSTVTEAPAVDVHNDSPGVDLDEDLQAVGQTVGPQTPPSSPGRVRRGRRRFFVGQWIDVKDTVNQWLECTVMDIADGKVLVHYHGWPTRWDEWLDFDSDRIAAFRTRTLHTLNPRQLSPVPTTRVQNAPRVGNNDVREMVAQLRDLLHEVMPHLDRFADLCEDDVDDIPEELEHPTTESIGAADGSAAPTGYASLSGRNGSHEAGWGRADQLSEMAHLVAPVFDRVGRMLIDSAHCLDPLLRSDLQVSSQRQQYRLTALRGRRSSSGVQRQAAAARIQSMELQDTSLSIRDLIATSPRNPRESVQPRRSIDVHIHAIVSPASLSSFAAMRNGGQGSSRSTGRLERNSPAIDHDEFDAAFGMPTLRPSQGDAGDGRAILNDDDSTSNASSNAVDSDQSRIPLLGAFRRDSESDTPQRRRTVEENLDEFLADDFFGSSYDHEHNHQAGRTSPQASQYSSIPSPISDNSSVQAHNPRSLIPEVAEAEERHQMQTRDRDVAASEDEGRDLARARAGSSSSSSSGGFPTFLDVMRRTLNGVRGFSFSSNNRRPSSLSADARPPVHGESSASSRSASSSSMSSLPPLSPRPNERLGEDSDASDSIIEDLDQLD